MYKHAHGQRGMTGIGWLIVLGLIAFFVLLVLRLAPGYLEYFKVESVLESLQQEPYLGSKTPPEIKRLLGNRMDVNSIDGFEIISAEQRASSERLCHAAHKDVVIEQKAGRTTVTADYEVRVPMFGNVDTVSTFHKSVELVAH
jgi:hypothetical protein